MYNFQRSSLSFSTRDRNILYKLSSVLPDDRLVGDVTLSSHHVFVMHGGLVLVELLAVLGISGFEPVKTLSHRVEFVM